MGGCGGTGQGPPFPPGDGPLPRQAGLRAPPDHAPATLSPRRVPPLDPAAAPSTPHPTPPGPAKTADTISPAPSIVSVVRLASRWLPGSPDPLDSVLPCCVASPIRTFGQGTPTKLIHIACEEPSTNPR